MGFIERLRQQQAESVLRQQQLKTQQEAREREGHQREAAENERRAQRQRQAKDFYQESGVSNLLAELRAVLPSAINAYPVTSQENSDSVCEGVAWDKVYNVTSKKGYSYYENYSNKYITVETCPDGNIIFHGGLFGSTTVGPAVWRNNKSKEMIFEKALEKAFSRPGVHRSSVYQDPGHANG